MIIVQRTPPLIRQNHSWPTLLRWAILLLTPLGGLVLAFLVYRDWRKRNPQPTRRLKGHAQIVFCFAALTIIASFAIRESLNNPRLSPGASYATAPVEYNQYYTRSQYRPFAPRMGYLFWVARPVIPHKPTALQLTLDWETMRLMAPLMAATRRPRPRPGRSFLFPASIGSTPAFEGFPMAFWRIPQGNGTGGSTKPNWGYLTGGRFMWGAPPPGPPEKRTT